MARRSSQSASRTAVTDNGMRFVGAATRLFREVRPENPEVGPGRPDDALFGVRLSLRPRGAGPVAHRLLALLRSFMIDAGVEMPALEKGVAVALPPGRLSGLTWRDEFDDDRWTGELLWRTSHPTVRGAAVTHHVVVEERPHFDRFTLLITADDGIASVRGPVGAGQVRPAYLDELDQQFEVTAWGGSVAPRTLRARDIEDFVRSTLLGRRKYPVAVLSPLEAGGYVMPPADVARELMGVAPLFVIDEQESTFRLSDVLRDKRLSCFFGALRIYMPGFTTADDPYDHPLMVRDRLGDPVMRAAEMGRAAILVARGVEPPTLAQTPPDEVAAPSAPDGPLRETVDDSGLVSPGAAPGASPGLAPGAAPGVAPGPAPGVAPGPAPGVALGAAPGAALGAAPGPPRMPSALDEQSGDAVAEATGTVEGRGSSEVAGRTGRSSEVDDPPPGSASARPESPPAAAFPPEVLEALVRGVEIQEQMARELGRLAEEVERLRALTNVRSAGTAMLERQIGRLRDEVEARLPRGATIAAGAEERGGEQDDARVGEGDDEGADSLLDVVHSVSVLYPDELLVLPEAEASAEESPYEDVDRVGAVLEAMALVARRRMGGGLGIPLKEAFREFGVDYRGGVSPSTSARQRAQYRFRGPDQEEYDCVEHVALGNARDPRYCLRIYFTSRAKAENRFVIGHVGKHFDVATTD